MLVKIKSRNTASFFQLLEYITEGKDKLFDKNGQSFVITRNLKGNSVESWTKQFKENEKCRKVKRSDNIKLYHEIISFHRNDSKNISLKKLEDITEQYLKYRNPNGMYVATPHFDKEHVHIHICASGIEYKTGKAMWMKKKELHDLKQKIQDYQLEKYPELSKSVIKHGKGSKSISDGEFRIKQRNIRLTDKDTVLGLLTTCYQKSASKQAFFALLTRNNLKTYTRSGKLVGVVYKGKKHRLGRLGFTPEMLNQLDLTKDRANHLKQIRETQQKSRNHDISRGR